MTHALAGPPTLLHVFPSFRVGGAQMRFAALANRFGARYRHLIVSLDGNDTARERLAPDLDFAFPRLLYQPAWTLTVPLSFPRKRESRRTAGNSVRVGLDARFRGHDDMGQSQGGLVLTGGRTKLAAFRRALRMLCPDVLVTHNWGSMDWVIANLPGLVRHIHIEDGFGPEERDCQFRRRVLARFLLLRRSTVVLPSRTLMGIAANTWRLPPHRLRYIPNGIDLARFAAPAVAAPGREPVIGTVAALRPEKALDRLLHAFRAVAVSIPARLIIAGDGPERPRLEWLAATLGVASRVQFTGHVADPAPLYAGFDVFALSSDTEQMPLSVIEAMAAGLAVAGTDVGDVRHMLAADNRRFVGPRDAGALAESLRALLAAPDLRERLGAANREKARRDYDQERMFAAYAALFDGVERQARTE